MKYVQPETLKSAFTCPHCSAIAKQDWWGKDWDSTSFPRLDSNPLKVAICQNCSYPSVWVDDVMYYPERNNAPVANSEMPEKVLKLYQEAAAIHSKSPRGAAALLRLSIQVLFKELGETGGSINSDIKRIVSKGLPEKVQKSLDIVRVTGNEAVHPGQIDTDDPVVVGQLFELVNIIVDYMIAMPKKIDNLYEALPADKLKGIESRDKKKKG